MKKRRSFITEITITLSAVLILFQGLGLILFSLFMPGDSAALSGQTLTFIVIYQFIILAAVIYASVIIINKNITRPINAISKSLAETDKQGTEAKKGDAVCSEIAVLTDSVNKIISHCRDLMGQFPARTENLVMELRQTEGVIQGILETLSNQITGLDGVISALTETDEQKRLIIESTQNLAEFSEDNVSSITEINSSVNEITGRTKELSLSSSSAYSAVVEMSEAARTLSENTETLSVSTEETTASLEEMASSLKEIEKGTKESATLTEQLRDLSSGEGMGSVAEAMEGMESISESVINSRDLVKGLKTKSKDIEMVLSVISDINKKTNLLSLNAAILASQAGEHGKGFSVVADEIKLLADETATSAKNITAIIESTQKDISAALKVAEESLKTVDSGNALVVKTGEAFREIIDIARNSSDVANKIQHATEEQVMGVTQINRTMEMLWEIVDNVAKATGRQEKGSESLSSLSEEIKRISEDIRRGMEDQNKGINMISKNLALENDKIRHISEAASKQEVVDQGLIHTIENIKAAARKMRADTNEMKIFLEGSVEEAETLLETMKGFRLE